jgi:hypothetical protein
MAKTNAVIKPLRTFLVLCIPLLIPICWVEIFRNHSIIHVGFVSRTFALFAIIPIIAADWLIKSGPQAREVGEYAYEAR